MQFLFRPKCPLHQCLQFLPYFSCPGIEVTAYAYRRGKNQNMHDRLRIDKKNTQKWANIATEQVDMAKPFKVLLI
jgi:hypothetical protein